MFQYVAVLAGDSALQLCIITERLILGDCDDLAVIAFILVHSLLLMSSFTLDICIMYLYENLSYMYPFLNICQRNACNTCALTIYGHGTTFERFSGISSILVMISPPIGVALPSVGVTVTLHGCYIYTCMGV